MVLIRKSDQSTQSNPGRGGLIDEMTICKVDDYSNQAVCDYCSNRDNSYTTPMRRLLGPVGKLPMVMHFIVITRTHWPCRPWLFFIAFLHDRPNLSFLT